MSLTPHLCVLFLVSSAYGSVASSILNAPSPKDYVYSTWTDSQLHQWLEDKGLIKTKTQATRDELLAKIEKPFASTQAAVYHSWSDSYIVRFFPLVYLEPMKDGR